MANADFPTPEPLGRIQVLVSLGITAVFLLLITKGWLYWSPIDPLPYRINLTSIAWGLGLAAGIAIASAIVYQVWPLYRRSADYYLTTVLQSLNWFDLIWIGLLPGMSEEILFRGVMLPAFGLTWDGIALTSLCFGVLHLSGWKQWPYVVWATLIGAVLGWSAVWSGNLLVPVVAHVVTNVTSGVIWKWRNRKIVSL